MKLSLSKLTIPLPEWKLKRKAFIYDSKFFLQTDQALEDTHEFICTNEYGQVLNNWIQRLQDQINTWCYSDEKSMVSNSSRKSTNSKRSRTKSIQKADNKNSGESITSIQSSVSKGLEKLSKATMKQIIMEMLENQNLDEDAFNDENEVSSLKREIKSSQNAIKVPKTVRI